MTKQGKKHPAEMSEAEKVNYKVVKIQEKLGFAAKKLLKGEELGEMSKSVRVVINMVIELYHDDVYTKDKAFNILDDLLYTYIKLSEKLDDSIKNEEILSKSVE